MMFRRIKSLILSGALVSPALVAADKAAETPPAIEKHRAPTGDTNPREVHGKAKAKITYRRVKNTQAYARNSAGQYLGIKVTPPKVMGPDQFVIVEVYNMSKSDLALVTFDITLHNNSGYDLSSGIEGDDVMPGQSALRKIATPGKGPFPPVNKVDIENLRVVNTNATEVVINAYVDLVTN